MPRHQDTVPVYTRLSKADQRLLRRVAKRAECTPAAMLRQWVERELARERKREQANRAAASGSAAA